MLRATAGRFVLVSLACCALTLQARASGRRPKNLLPDTLAVNAAVMALADSLDSGGLNWVWAAPDGTCWLMYWSYGLYRAMRRIGPDGRVTTADAQIHQRPPWSAHPLAALQGGDALICLTFLNSESGRKELARIGEGKVKALGGPLYYWDIATLDDDHDVLHLFALGHKSDQAYMRYSVTDDTISELSSVRFHDSTTWAQDSGYKHVRLPGEAPWGLGKRTVMQWDGDGLVVGATTTGWSSETPEVFRFRVPDCSLLARKDLEVTSTAHSRTVGIDYREANIVKSGKGYWLFTPSKDSISIEGQKMPCVYSYLLDANLNPVRPAAMSDLTARPFAEAPLGSKVEVSLLDGGVEIPSYGADKRSFTLRFIAFGPDGHIYCTEMHDTIMTHRDRLTDAGELQVVGGGDSVGLVSVVVPIYPIMALQAGIEGQAVASTFVGSNGEVDSVIISRSSGNRFIDAAAQRAARKARFAGSFFENGTSPIACDLSYRFTVWPPKVSVVEARLRQK
jgi:TonB family protein